MADETLKIKAALEGHLNAIPDLPNIAWENTPFNPTTGTPWLQPRFIPNNRTQRTMGTQFITRYDGLMMIHVHTPEGQGSSEAMSIAKTLVEAFEATTNITNDDITVHIRGAETRSGVHEAPWYYITVVVDWFCHK